MKRLVFGIAYPYRCPDCPELHPFKSRIKFAHHRRARHPAFDVDPAVNDLDPFPLVEPEVLGLELELGHGTGALPTLDGYDERAR